MSEVKTYAVNCNDAWLNTYGDDISGSYVKYKDYQEMVVTLEAKCAALAAENAAMHETIEAVRSVADNSSGIAGWHLNGDIATWEEILPEINDIETPATDAFLAEVRAQGVEMLAKNHQSIVNALKGDSLFSDGEYRHAAIVSAAVYFAAELRKGGNQK